MSKIHVTGRMTASYPDCEEAIRRWYPDAQGLRLIERRSVAHESDFSNGIWQRESPDNGRTWGDWEDVYRESFQKVGEKDEILRHAFETTTLRDPVSGNQVSCAMLRYFFNGHVEAYRRMWGNGEAEYRDHCYLAYRRPDGTDRQQFLAYEEGADYDPANPRDPAYMDHNLAYFGNIHPAADGDLLIPIGPNVVSCCRILGLDVQEVFPSCPQLMCGVLLVRAHWDAEKEAYDLTYSRPAVIDDLQSSRGVCEPCVSQLASGRILMVFRGSNTRSEAWHTRIEPGTPGFKWYLYSDDGGRTFTRPMPWRFDTGEVVYSSATVSDFFQSKKTGKTYWIGNITDPTKIDGNYPRYPLQICQVDDRYGYLLKDTLTEIDTRRPGDSELVQLSNFSLLENRETLNLEVRLAKIGQHSVDEAHHDLYSESWCYEIELN